MKNAIISLRNAVVEYDGVQVLKSVSLDIMDKQFVTLLGPSGCGKTTTLRIIGGFAEMASGELFFNGTKINNLRRISVRLIRSSKSMHYSPI